MRTMAAIMFCLCFVRLISNCFSTTILTDERGTTDNDLRKQQNYFTSRQRRYALRNNNVDDAVVVLTGRTYYGILQALPLITAGTAGNKLSPPEQTADSSFFRVCGDHFHYLLRSSAEYNRSNLFLSCFFMARPRFNHRSAAATFFQPIEINRSKNQYQLPSYRSQYRLQKRLFNEQGVGSSIIHGVNILLKKLKHDKDEQQRSEERQTALQRLQAKLDQKG